MHDLLPRLPNWPPPDDELIGIERARAYIAWIRAHAGPHLAEAERMIRERYPDAGTIERSSAPAMQLATWGLSPTMRGLAIGCVWAHVSGGTWAMVDIVLTRDGHLLAKPGWNMRG